MSDTLHPTERNLSNAELASKVYSFVEQKPDPETDYAGASAILLMGGDNHLATAKRAFELYLKTGLPIVCTTNAGYFSEETSRNIPEAEDYKRLLTDLENSYSSEHPEHQKHMRLFCRPNPDCTDTLKELIYFQAPLQEAGIAVKKVLMVDSPIHQQRAWRNACETVPNIEFVNCPAEVRFDPSNTKVQKRLIAEIERLSVYVDTGMVEIPIGILRAASELRNRLRKDGKYIKDKDHPRVLYKADPPEKFWRPGEVFNRLHPKK